MHAVYIEVKKKVCCLARDNVVLFVLHKCIATSNRCLTSSNNVAPLVQRGLGCSRLRAYPKRHKKEVQTCLFLCLAYESQGGWKKKNDFLL